MNNSGVRADSSTLACSDSGQASQSNQITRKTLQLSVQRSRIVGHGGARSGQYAVYVIECQMENLVWECSRRYSHFLALFQSLRSQYGLNTKSVRALLASIGLEAESKSWSFPGKSPRSLAQSIIDERTKAFDLFLRALCASPRIAPSPELLTFLGALVPTGPTKDVATSLTDDYDQSWSDTELSYGTVLDEIQEVSRLHRNPGDLGPSSEFTDTDEDAQSNFPPLRHIVSPSVAGVPAEWLLPWSPAVTTTTNSLQSILNRTGSVKPRSALNRQKVSDEDVESNDDPHRPLTTELEASASSHQISNNVQASCEDRVTGIRNASAATAVSTNANTVLDATSPISTDTTTSARSSEWIPSLDPLPTTAAVTTTPGETLSRSISDGVEAVTTITPLSPLSEAKSLHSSHTDQHQSLQKKGGVPTHGEIAPATLFQLARPGDVLLVRNPSNAIGTIQRALTGSRYDHVALITSVPPAPRPLPSMLCVLEATVQYGVRLLPLGHWLEQILKSGSTVVLRRLHGIARSPGQLHRLEAFERSVEGSKYSVSGIFSSGAKLSQTSNWVRAVGTRPSRAHSEESGFRTPLLSETSGIEPSPHHQQNEEDPSASALQGIYAETVASENAGYFCSELVYHALIALGAVDLAEDEVTSSKVRPQVIMPVHFQAVSFEPAPYATDRPYNVKATRSRSKSVEDFASTTLPEEYSRVGRNIMCREDSPFFTRNCGSSPLLRLATGVYFGPELMIRPKKSGMPLQHARIISVSSENPTTEQRQVSKSAQYPVYKLSTRVNMNESDRRSVSPRLSTTHSDSESKSNPLTSTHSAAEFEQSFHGDSKADSISTTSTSNCGSVSTSSSTRKVYALLGPEAARHHASRQQQQALHPLGTLEHPLRRWPSLGALTNSESSSTSSMPTMLFNQLDPASVPEHVSYISPVDILIEYYFV